MAHFSPFPRLPVFSVLFETFRRFFEFILPPKHPVVIQDLLSRRTGYKGDLLHRNERIRQILSHASSTSESSEPHPDDTTEILSDIDAHPELSALISALLSSSRPELLAEIREWQYNAHWISCIDSALGYFSKAPPTPDSIGDAMLSTISAFPPPQQHNLEPAPPLPNDRELVMSRRVFFDEPKMQSLIRSLDEKSRITLQAAADRERSRLPIFPAHLQWWNADKCVDKD